MFSSTDNRFHIKFANGNTISVAFGYGSYSDNRNNPNSEPSQNAEVWGWDKNDIPLFEEPLGWQTPDEVAALIAKYSA